MDAWELFDLENDPQELKNEINNPDYRKIALKLKSELKKLMKKYKNDKSVEAFKEITSKNFGGIGTN